MSEPTSFLKEKENISLSLLFAEWKIPEMQNKNMVAWTIGLCACVKYNWTNL